MQPRIIFHNSRHMLTVGLVACGLIVGLLSLLAFDEVTASPAHATSIVDTCDQTGLFAALHNGDQVSFRCSGVIVLSTTIDIVQPTVIDGSGQQVTLSGANVLRIFHVNAGAALTLKNLTLANGQADQGSAIYNRGTLTITDSNFTANHASNEGGAIYNAGGTLLLRGAIFSDNRASNGGGIYNNGGILETVNSTFTLNSASNGGSIYNQNGIVRATPSTFARNSAGNYGGGIYNDRGIVTIANSTFADNRASNDNYPLEALSQSTITQSNPAEIMPANTFTFTGNSAGNHGGGLYNDRGILIVTNSTFATNSAGKDGGGAYNASGVVNLTGNTFASNSAGKDGGGVYNAAGVVNLLNNTFADNSAGKNGGGLYVADGAVNVTNGTLAGNNASLGGGIYSTVSNRVTLINTIVANSTNGGDCSGDVSDDGHNMDSDGTCGLDSDRRSISESDLHLTVLSDNGGPTWTMALGVGSAAINAGDNTHCPGVDQRGVQRLLGPSCDIGAYEAPLITLAPLSATLPVGAQYTVTATVFYTPVKDVKVLFQVAGANPITDHSTTTNLAGQAIFSYIGKSNVAATDTITAWINLDGNNTLDPQREPFDVVRVNWQQQIGLTITAYGTGAGTEYEAVRTVTATVRTDDVAQTPVDGLRVGFQVTGGNQKTQFADTGQAGRGKVVFSYISKAPTDPSAPNMDNMTAWIDLNPNGRLDGNEPVWNFSAPSAVTLASFTAQANATGAIILRWATGVEIDNAGFNLYWAISRTGPYVKLNDQLIAAQGMGAGASYRLVDRQAGGGPRYYLLEDVNYDGVSTQHGPIRSTVGQQNER